MKIVLDNGNITPNLGLEYIGINVIFKGKYLIKIDCSKWS
ncbi:hypothetical protein GCM10023142_30760 [Anaerocolumna aminovalerica]